MNLEKRKMPRIALMDCSSIIARALEEEKYQVHWGSFGFASGHRRLPCPPYEIDIFSMNREITLKENWPQKVGEPSQTKHLILRISK